VNSRLLAKRGESDTALTVKRSRAGVGKYLISQVSLNPCKLSRDIFLETLAAETTDYQSRRIAGPNAATRNIDIMAAELAANGYVGPEVRAMVLDEELTHAVEILAAQEAAYAVVPRSYEQIGNDLVDIHRQSLRQVFSGGIEHSEQEVLDGVPGAGWELERRKAELNNLEIILAMPENTACIEISAPPTDRPEHEQLAQHYNGLTMIRVSTKKPGGKVMQYNYALPLSNPEFLLAVQEKLGRDSTEMVVNSQELLERPITQTVDQASSSLVHEIDNLIGAAMLEVAVGHSAIRMIRKAIANRREAWDFVSSDEHADIHNEFLGGMEYAARLNMTEREHAVSAIRSGFWKEYKDRFNDRKISNQAGGIIAEAASRAVAAGDVFIACGSTVSATQFTAQESTASRASIANSLLREVKGSGNCSACGAKGVLYGCGVFCGRCNEKWCSEYKRTGKQLSPRQLSYLSYSRGTKPEADTADMFEELRQDWKRMGLEIERKRRLKKLREAERAKKSREEQELQQAA